MDALSIYLITYVIRNKNNIALPKYQSILIPSNDKNSALNHFNETLINDLRIKKGDNFKIYSSDRIEKLEIEGYELKAIPIKSDSYEESHSILEEKVKI